MSKNLNSVCASGVAANECFSAPSAPNTASDQNGASAALCERMRVSVTQNVRQSEYNEKGIEII